MTSQAALFAESPEPRFALRAYQREAVDAVARAMARPEAAPLVVLPTGSGKSLVIADICLRIRERRPRDRTLLLSHVKELIDQGQRHIERRCRERVGVMCGGLGEHDASQPITAATIQTAARRVEELRPIDWVIVDEAHRVPMGGDGQYRTLLDALGARVIGLTATPYRLDGGVLTDGDVFTEIAYTAPVHRLIEEGWLSPLVTRSDPAGRQRLDGVCVVRGDYDRAAASDLMQAVAAETAADIAMRARATGRQSILVFAAGIDHALLLAAELDREGLGPECVFGETPTADRDRIVAGFRAGEIRTLVNISVLTTGFDAPGVDLVALCRPTLSAGLYVQMVGRGLRLAPGKSDCLVLDYAGLIDTHGPIDWVLPRGRGGRPGDVDSEPLTKTCLECWAPNRVGVEACVECGAVFPEIETAPHASRASKRAVVGGGEMSIPVVEVRANRHEKKGTKPGEKPPTLRVIYADEEWREQSEWLCIEHGVGSFPWRKALQAWAQLYPDGPPMPETVDEAVEIVRAHEPPVVEIGVTRDGRWLRVARRTLGERDERSSLDASDFMD
jgi:DNA repair protein RadD